MAVQAILTDNRRDLLTALSKHPMTARSLANTTVKSVRRVNATLHALVELGWAYPTGAKGKNHAALWGITDVGRDKLAQHQ